MVLGGKQISLLPHLVLITISMALAGKVASNTRPLLSIYTFFFLVSFHGM